MERLKETCKEGRLELKNSSSRASRGLPIKAPKNAASLSLSSCHLQHPTFSL